MSTLDRQGLISQSNYLFPDNTTAEITPADVRQFNEDLADSLALTGSNVISASYASNVPYDGILNKPTLVSGSSQVILQDTTGLLSGSRIDGAVADATNALYAQNTVTTGKNLSGGELLKGTPLYFTGSGTSGNLVGVYPADAGNPDRMPAGGIAGETIADGEEGVVLLDGYIGNVNTSIFTSGDEIFVGVGGGYTNVAPTGSTNLIQHLGNVEKSAVNGSGVIQMMGEVRGVPNIQEGYVWAGNASGVATAVSTGSFAGAVPVGVATTGSNTFDGDQVISGSVTIQDTNAPMSGLVLKNNSGGGDVQIIPAGDFITTFNSSTLTGITNYGGRVISGSWGEIGNSVIVGTSSPGIYNNYTGSATSAAIKLQHRVDPNVQGLNYSSFISFPPTNGNNGESIVELKGRTVSILPTTGSDTTRLLVDGDVSGSNFTGSFIGDGSGLTNITASIDTSSLATLGSNTFVGNQIISGNLEMGPNTAIVGQTIDAQEISTPTLLVDSIEPNNSTEISITSGNVTLSGTGQVLQNTNGAVVASTIEGQAEIASPLLLVDTIEVNTGTDIGITATNLIVSGNIQMAPSTAVVGPIFEATSEVATPTLLVDTIEANTGTNIRINSDTEITASAASSQALKVWDGVYTDGGAPWPILQIYSANDRTAAGAAVEVAGGTFFAPGLSSEPLGDVSGNDTFPLYITDAVSPRLVVNSRNQATATGVNVDITGGTRIRGEGGQAIRLQAKGGTLQLSGSNVTIESPQPVFFNTGLTISGATNFNTAVYKDREETSVPNVNLNNGTDNFVISLTSGSTTNISMQDLVGGNLNREVTIMFKQPSVGFGYVQFVTGSYGSPYNLMYGNGQAAYTASQAPDAVDVVKLQSIGSTYDGTNFPVVVTGILYDLTGGLF